MTWHGMAWHGKAIFLLYKMERSVTTGTGTGTMNNAKAKATQRKATQSKTNDKKMIIAKIIG
jgi:hypothetical protein